jgi:hypothetical protein
MIFMNLIGDLHRDFTTVMGMRMTPYELIDPVLAQLDAALAPLGYRRSGASFQRELSEVVHLVELQSAQGAADNQVAVTVNLGVYAPVLVDADIRQYIRPSIPQAHWRERLGILLPERRDRWWTIESAEAADLTGCEIAGSVEVFGLPTLAKIPDLAALRRIWEAGASPGLSDYQRRRHLERLLTRPR